MRAPFSFWKSGGAAVPPMLTAVAPTLGDTLGGELLTIIGTGFTGATAVSIGGTAAVGFSVLSDTEIIAIAPAHAAAAGQSILVTAPGGTNSANTLYEFWSPAELALTGFWERGDYDAQVGTWTARASAGTSGGRSATQATAINTPGETNLEPIFDGVNDSLIAAGTPLDYFGSGAYSGFAIVKLTAPTRDDVTGYSDQCIANTSSAYWQLFVRSSGLVGIDHVDTAHVTVTTAIAFGAFVLVKFRFDGAAITIGTDGNAFAAPVPAGILGGTSGSLAIFLNQAFTYYLGGTARSLGFAASNLSDATFAKILKWAQARHGVAT